ncbi:MAG TPA: DUF167 domain-containing protein [Candidatus Aminicenantes bacterium]|nr:DUF167 domain-containing protein [Candidatus Aminicenantes bacterium]HRY64087.1 DUF167 domain-containing protein [Candidatus Aminicenantes bacterium]HRZ71000.1 DUF167 domain-containing protein [Candidatus Aminicenantes bacterium]
MARILTVKARPRSKAPGVEAVGPSDFLVRVRAAPEKGRANAEVAELLARHLGVPPSRLTLLRGASSSHKQFRLED